MKKRTKLSKLLNILSPDGTRVDFDEFDKEVSTLKSKLQEKIQARTLEDVNVQLNRFRKSINLQPLVDAVTNIRSSVEEEYADINKELDQKSTELRILISKSIASPAKVRALEEEINSLQVQVLSLEEVRKTDARMMAECLTVMTDVEDRMAEMDLNLSARLDALEEVEPEEVIDWQKKIEELRRDLMSRISNIGGGSMNRQITVANVDPLTKYTDINLKAGSNMTITTSVNDTTKRVDITFASSGGGGSVVGTSRSITTLTTSSVIGTTSGVDQVYLANGGIQITLPTAIGDTNLYTIKNVGTSSVLVNTTGGQTIDNDPTVIMPVRYTSVDLISDTANWNVT